MQKNLKNIPSVDKILSHPDVVELSEKFSNEKITALTREKLTYVRESIQSGKESLDISTIVEHIKQAAKIKWRPWPQKVINGTGIILHTNLGRSPISADASKAAEEASQNYSDLELNLNSGKRGSRQEHASNLLSDVTGAECGLVVNNNAAATLLALTSLTAGKEVIISRSEAVEIGGGFRIPDVLSQSGAKLIEVGTTNRTYWQDYDEAISEDTGAIMSIHASNFKLVGFTHQPTIREIVKVGTAKNIPVIHDVGSGSILDTGLFGLNPEPQPQESIKAGVDLCLFSGDKLLGGPQSGIIVGKKKYVNQLEKHPLARAFRIDKMNLAGLNATLTHYIKGEELSEIPIWRMISASRESLLVRAESILKKINASTSLVNIIDTKSAVGGGSLPGALQASIGLRISASNPDLFARSLRTYDFPLIGRIESDTNIIDVRTILENQDEYIPKAINEALKHQKE